MLSGCHGGKFFNLDLSWCDVSSDDRISIRWSLFPRFIQPFVALESLTDVDTKHLIKNRWWLWSDDRPPSTARRPSWWDVTEDSLQVRVAPLVLILPLILSRSTSLNDVSPRIDISLLPSCFRMHCMLLVALLSLDLTSSVLLHQHLLKKLLIFTLFNLLLSPSFFIWLTTVT